MAFEDALTRLAHTNPKELSDVSQETIADDAIEKLVANFEDASQIDDEGIEFWYARDLQTLLGYGSSWQNFSKVIEKAKLTCESTGHNITDHFNDVIKMVPIGSGAERETNDIRLTRYACYLIAQNGDSRKKPIAFAQTYFVIQTRRQEIRDENEAKYVPLSEDHKRLLLRDEIKEHNKRLAVLQRVPGLLNP